MPKHHNLKILLRYFELVLSGDKSFEIREDDRDFSVGDTVSLKEFCDNSCRHTGREIKVEITYITAYNQKSNYIVFSYRKLETVGVDQ
jgi:hypothetical protein